MPTTPPSVQFNGKLTERITGKAMYNTNRTSHVVEIPEEKLPFKVQNVNFTTRDGFKLHAWYVPAKAGKPTVIHAHGNTGNINRDFRVETMEQFIKRGYGYFIFDYRGYGKSEGRPTEQGLYEDFRSASRYLSERLDIPINRQIALGESLGGGVVTQVATELPFRAVFLYSTFTAMADVVEKKKQEIKHFPKILPVERFFNRHFRSIDKIQHIKAPLIIAHGTQDELTPYEMGERLFAKATSPEKRFVKVEGSTHNYLFKNAGDQLLDTLDKLLKATEDKPITQPRGWQKFKGRMMSSWFNLKGLLHKAASDA